MSDARWVDGGILGGLEPGDAREVGMSPDQLAAAERLMARALEERVFPGGVLVVLRAGRAALARPFGRLTYSPASPPVTLATVYDLASLTKVIVTTTLAMQLVEAGALDLDRPVDSYLPEFSEGDARKPRVSIRDLLTHVSGMPPVFPGHFPAFAEAREVPRDRDHIVRACVTMPLDHEPRLGWPTATSASSRWERYLSGWAARGSTTSARNGC